MLFGSILGKCSTGLNEVIGLGLMNGSKQHESLSTEGFFLYFYPRQYNLLAHIHFMLED